MAAYVPKGDWRTLRAPILIAGLAACLTACGGSSADLKSTLTSGDQKVVASSAIVPAGELKSASVTPAAEKAAQTLTASATPGNSAYLIGPQDVLDVSVFKVPELTKSVQVADTGTINLPLVEEVPAMGKTTHDLERDLTAKLGGKYLQKPQVTVVVKEYNSQRVTVEGAVKKPGVYPVRGQMTLLQLVASAEGLSDNSDSTVVVFRGTEGKRTAARFSVDEIRSGTSPDPRIQSGDVIVVPSSMMKETFNNFLKILPIAGVFAAVL